MPTASIEGDCGAATEIRLPEWASDIAVNGSLLGYANTLLPGDEEPWRRCDWLAVAWHMLSGSVERDFEKRHGAILSYSFRLPRETHGLFERAWVNRIFLFLRRWAAHESGIPEEALFGPLPPAEIVLTHDVDAIALTAEIRLKQSAFQILNAGRALSRANVTGTFSRLGDALRYGFSHGDFRTLSLIRQMEEAAGLRSRLHFYGGAPGIKRGSARRILMDPGYDVASDYFTSELAALSEGGWTVGLHQSFEAWENAGRMAAERDRVAAAAGLEVNHCRQHWLHFSWEATWRAQEAAGLKEDSTLGFNDRAGFRAGHALRIRPWDFETEAPLLLHATPMILMDSHFYDYEGGERDAGAAMKRWLDEVRAVGGQATVNWHTHTITDVYGWRRGYEELLTLLA
jgi:hypothetical protein